MEKTKLQKGKLKTKWELILARVGVKSVFSQRFSPPLYTSNYDTVANSG